MLSQAATPAALALTTTQIVVTLLAGIVGLTAVGVAFGRSSERYGRLAERQKASDEALDKTLATISAGMKSIQDEISTFHEQHVETTGIRNSWAEWRKAKNVDDVGRDDALRDVEKDVVGLDKRVTAVEGTSGRLDEIERDRRKRTEDRRQE